MEELKHTSWPTVDGAAISEELKVAQRGASDGDRESPPPSATSLSQTEQEIVGYFRAKITQAQTVANRIWSNQRTNVEQVNCNALIGELNSIRSRIKTTATELLRTAGERVQRLHHEWRKAEQDLKKFRVNAGLDREADYPDNHWKMWAIFSAIFLLESVINAQSYAQANMLGLAGGLLAAIFIAAIFAIIAKLFSFTFRQLYHVSVLRKVVGLFFTMLLATAAVVAALLAGHYRHAAQMNPDQAEELAWQFFVSAPFELGGFASVMLTLLSALICASYIAIFLRMDDPYPGYGDKDRKEKTRRIAYEAGMDEFADELHEAREDLEGEIVHLQSKVNRAMGIVSNPPDPRTIEHDYALWLTDCEEQCRAVLSEYREQNKDLRDSEPPAHFAEAFQFEANFREINLSGADRMGEYCRRAEAALMNLDTEIQELFSLVYQSLNIDAVMDGNDGP